VKKSTYKPLAKNRKNTSGRASKAKRDGLNRAKEAKARLAGKSTDSKKSKQRLASGTPYKRQPLKANGAPKPLPEDLMVDMKGMKLRRILRMTPRMFHNNAQYVRMLSVKKAKTKSGLTAYLGVMRTHDPMRDKPPRKRNVSIIGLDPDSGLPVNRQRVLLQCDCVTGDTRVLTADGWKTIYELAQPLKLNHYPITYMVNGKPKMGSHPFYKGQSKVLNVMLSNGESIKATRDHKFLLSTPNGQKNKWVRLKDVTVGDKLITNHVDSISANKDASFYEAFFLGVMMGDGSVFASGRPDLQLYGDKSELIPILEQLGVVDYVVDLPTKKEGKRVWFNQKAYELIARFLYRNKSGMRKLTISELLGYLSGLICTDGTVYKSGDILLRGAEIYLRELFEALSAEGISNTTFYTESAKGTITNFGTRTKDLCALRISRRDVLPILDSLLLTDSRRNRISDNRPPSRPKKNYVKVTSITNGGLQHVYDITVPDGNRFVANGLVIHNCENYAFTWEYANAAHNAARLLFSNGMYPSFTNPQLAPGACKHLIAFAHNLILDDR